MTRTLPTRIAGGPEVSELAYRIVLVAFGDSLTPPPRALDSRPVDRVSTGEVVTYLIDRLGVDEGDVLRALAELEHAGVLIKEVNRP